MKTISICLMLIVACETSSAGADPKFARVVIDDNFPGAYQVEIADINGDKKPDIIAVGGSTCAWYENPSWKKRVITDANQTPGIISTATLDIDGDGKSEVAIAYDFEMNEPKRGKLGLASQGDGDAWSFLPITSVSSIHRLRWGDVDHDGQAELIVASLFGRTAAKPSYNQADGTIRSFRHGPMFRVAKNWSSEIATERPVLHAIDVLPLRGREYASILTADNLGVAEVSYNVGAMKPGWSIKPLVAGALGQAPARGASEVHLGRLASGHAFLATVEPWHGDQVAVYRENDPGTFSFGPRTVIDATLADGHALWVADIDNDGNDEIFAGHRGNDHRVSIYKFDTKSWIRTVIDRQVAAQDLRGSDLDGDGTPDIVAVGGATHNVVWYKPLK